MLHESHINQKVILSPGICNFCKSYGKFLLSWVWQAIFNPHPCSTFYLLIISYSLTNVSVLVAMVTCILRLNICNINSVIFKETSKEETFQVCYRNCSRVFCPEKVSLILKNHFPFSSPCVWNSFTCIPRFEFIVCIFLSSFSNTANRLSTSEMQLLSQFLFKVLVKEEWSPSHFEITKLQGHNSYEVPLSF